MKYQIITIKTENTETILKNEKGQKKIKLPKLQLNQNITAQADGLV